MKTILETERLRLRELTADDAPFMFELVTDPSWIEFIGDRGWTSHDDARKALEEKYVAAYAEDGFGLWGVTLKGRDELMGICGLIKRESLEDVDVGFAFLPRHVGKGYASEGAAASLEYARTTLGLRRVVAITTPTNVRSIHVLEKIGLRYERAMYLPNDPEELSLYAIEWKD